MDLVSGLQDGLDENRALISVLKHGALSSSASSLVSTHTLSYISDSAPIAQRRRQVCFGSDQRALSRLLFQTQIVKRGHKKTKASGQLATVCARRQSARSLARCWTRFNPLRR
jgi:hypothetical protein